MVKRIRQDQQVETPKDAKTKWGGMRAERQRHEEAGSRLRADVRIV